MTLTDSGGAAPVSQQFTITVSPPPALSISTTSLAPGTVDAVYAGAVATQGGVAPLAWSVTLGALPPGLVLNPANGKITGIPTTAGTFSFTVQVKDSALPTSQTATQALSIAIATPAPLSITTSSLPAGVTATGYSGTLQATGGVLPYTWSITNGQLPAGLSINTSGTITGTPVLAGSSTFTVQVADSEVNPTTGNPNPMTATKQFTITVTAGANNNKLLFNGYSFLFTGFDKDGSVAIAGFLTADGSGNITSGGEDITRVSKVVTGASLTGTYSIDSNGDGHGKLELIATLGQNTLTTDYRLVLDSNGNAKFFEDKPATSNGDTLQTHGEGIMKPIVGSSFSAANLSGNYAFEFAGQDLSQKPAALGGVLNADGNATFSSGASDFNDAGTFSSGSVSGSFSFIAGNRGTAALTLPLPSGQATLNFVYYFVSPSDLYLVEVDSSPQGNGTPTEFRLAGEMILQQPTTAFNSSILAGSERGERKRSERRECRCIRRAAHRDGMQRQHAGYAGLRRKQRRDDCLSIFFGHLYGEPKRAREFYGLGRYRGSRARRGSLSHRARAGLHSGQRRGRYHGTARRAIWRAHFREFVSAGWVHAERAFYRRHKCEEYRGPSDGGRCGEYVRHRGRDRSARHCGAESRAGVIGNFERAGERSRHADAVGAGAQRDSGVGDRLRCVARKNPRDFERSHGPTPRIDFPRPLIVCFVCGAWRADYFLVSESFSSSFSAAELMQKRRPVG